MTPVSRRWICLIFIVLLISSCNPFNAGTTMEGRWMGRMAVSGSPVPSQYIAFVLTAGDNGSIDGRAVMMEELDADPDFEGASSFEVVCKVEHGEKLHITWFKKIYWYQQNELYQWDLIGDIDTQVLAGSVTLSKYVQVIDLWPIIWHWELTGTSDGTFTLTKQ